MTEPVVYATLAVAMTAVWARERASLLIAGVSKRGTIALLLLWVVPFGLFAAGPQLAVVRTVLEAIAIGSIVWFVVLNDRMGRGRRRTRLHAAYSALYRESRAAPKIDDARLRAAIAGIEQERDPETTEFVDLARELLLSGASTATGSADSLQRGRLKELLERLQSGEDLRDP